MNTFMKWKLLHNFDAETLKRMMKWNEAIRKISEEKMK